MAVTLCLKPQETNQPSKTQRYSVYDHSSFILLYGRFGAADTQSGGVPRGEREGSSRRFMPGSLARISLKYWLTEEMTSLWTSKAFVLQANSRSVRNLRRTSGGHARMDG